MRILLVSDDDPFAERVIALAASRGVGISRAHRDDDLELMAIRHGANIVALDTNDALRRTARAATAFAGLHPQIAVVLVSSGATAATFSGLPLVDKWWTPERLLLELERAQRELAG